MAAQNWSVARSKSATQAGAFVDTVTFSYGGDTLQIINRGSVDIYWTYSSTSPAAVPTVGGDDCYLLPAGQSVSMQSAAGRVNQVALIGTGMVYTVQVF